jgi:hypothetical protein
MTNDTPVTRAQTNFLRAFRENPTGPAPADWPAPGVLRRWLKDKRFRKSLTAVRDAIRFQTDFHLAAAASTAARAVQTNVGSTLDAALDPAALADLSKTLKSLTDLLRLAHLRERYTTPRPAAPAAAPRRKRDPFDDLNDENRRILGPGKPMHYYEKCLNNAGLLKDLLLYGVQMGGGHIYDQFLVSFPEELAQAHEYYDRHRKTAPTPSTPDPTKTS